MKELFDALINRYKSDDLIASGPVSALRIALGNNSVDPNITSDGFYPYKAPQNTAMPYICYSLVGASPLLHTMGMDEINSARVQFSIWSDQAHSPLQVTELANLTKTVFDFTCLIISGRTHFYCKRIFENLLDDPDFGWQYVIQYEVVTEV